MSAAKGGKRTGAGRPAGKISKAKKALSELAKTYAPAALKTLADIAKSGESEAARVSAAVAILDRAYGKPPQSLEHSGPEGGPIQVTTTPDEISRSIESKLVSIAAAARAGTVSPKPDA